MRMKRMNKIEEDSIISNEVDTSENNDTSMDNGQESFISIIFRFIVNIIKIFGELGRNIKA